MRPVLSAVLRFSVLSLAFLVCPNVHSQVNSLVNEGSRPVPGEGHDFIYGLAETVSPANGNVNLTIPLQVPKGRGLTMPISLMYNSGSAHRFFSAAQGCPGFDNSSCSAGANWTTIYPDKAAIGHGWTDTVPYATALGFVAGSYSQNAGPGAYALCDITQSYNFYDMNGGSHPLGLAAISTPVGTSNQSGMDACTHLGYGGATYYTPSYYYSSSQSGGDDRVHASFDASCAGNDSESPNCEGASPGFSVQDSSGNTYRFPAGSFGVGTGYSQPEPARTITAYPTTITDRNGNVINFSVSSSTGYTGQLPITDTLGRQLLSATSYTVAGLSYSLGGGTARANYTVPSQQIPAQAGNPGCGTWQNVSGESYDVNTSLTLPSGKSFTFLYDPAFGLLSEIDYPDGGWVKYTWKTSDTYSDLAIYDGVNPSGGPPMTGACIFKYSAPVVATRTVGYSKGSSPALTQTFNYQTNWGTTASTNTRWSTKVTTVTTTDNVTGLVSKTVYTYTSVDAPYQPNEAGRLSSQIPIESSIETYDFGSTKPGSLLQTVNKTWLDQSLITSQQTVLADGTTSKTAFCYNSTCAGGAGFPGYVQEKDDYDFGQTTATRKTLYAYTVGGAPCSVEVEDGSGNKIAETDSYIDGGTSPCASGRGATMAVSGLPAGTHDEVNYGPNGTYARGNPTTIVKWLNTGGTVQTSYTYDETGQVLTMTDPCGNASCADVSGTAHTTTYLYTDQFADQSLPFQTNAFPTKITYPTINGVAHSVSATYNYVDGQVASSIDENSNTTNFTYADPMRRLTQVQGPPDPNNSNQRPTTTYCYDNATCPGEITTSTTLSSSASLTQVSVIDGLGHVTQTQTTSDPSGTDLVDTAYNGMGGVYTVSNPYRGTSSQLTTFTYDGLGRLTLAQNPDQSSRSVSYLGNTSTSCDEASRCSQQTHDVFGNLTKVVEAGASGTATGPNTTYTYDLLGNLSTVTQNGNSGDTARSRSFSYDSLSRLIKSTNPESGTICYGVWVTVNSSQTCQNGYDANGNLSAKTDARSVTTNYTYDALNRLLTKSSAGVTGVPGFNYLYGYDKISGGTVTNGIGHLLFTTTSPGVLGGVAEQFWYDSMGRMTSQSVYLPSAPSTPQKSGASYDLAGNMTSLTYPDGRTVQQGIDGAGRISAVTYSSWNGSTTNLPQTYFSETNGYDPAGHLINATFGNGVPYGAGYDARERIHNLAYGPSSAPAWSKQYAWTPNSNLQSQTDLITGVQRQFNYDTLNRLTAAQDIYSNLAIPSGSNGSTGSTSSSGSGAEETPGGTGVQPQWTDPDDSNLLDEVGSPNSRWSYPTVTTTINSAVNAPDGTQTARAVVGNSCTGSTCYLEDSPVQPSLYSLETMSGSVWMRTLPGVASQAVNLYLMANGASVGLTQVTLTATWQQVQVTGLMPDNVTSLTFRLGGVASGYGFMMWNPMLEDQGIQGTSITNILPYSQLPGASSWSGTSYSVTSGNQPAPDGSLTASTITADPVNTGSYIYDSVANPSPESGQPITGSVYLRSSSSLSVAVLIMEKVGTTISTCGQVSPVLNTTWQRVIVTCTSQNPASQLFLRVGGGGFANSASFQLWGAQLELATTAGPYVATDATSVTASNSLTNILQYSQQPNGPSWVNTYNFPGVTNAIVAPDGSKTAYEATAPGGSGWLTNDVSNPPLYNNATVTASVYLRVPSGTGSINFYLIAENPSGRVLLQQVPASLNTTWRRFSTTQPLPNSLTRLFIQIGENETTGQIVDVWGSQIELSNHAGPYIETSSLPVITGSDPVNILPNSQNLSGANWGMASGSCSVNAATAVDGTNTAAICTSQSTSTDSYLRATVPNPSLYDGETVTASVYLRSISGTQNINLYLKNTGDQGASTMAQSSITATTTWQRFDLTATLQNGSTFVGLQIGGGNSVAGGQGFEVWGAQFVVGSTPAPYSSTNGNTTVYATGQSGTLVPTGLNQTYAYDSFGNILQNGSFNSSYTAKNQLFGYAYDAAGNLLSDGMNLMTWDAESRMSTASGATYIYDAEGNRVEKQGSTVTDTVYFGGKPIARYSGGQWTDLIYGPTGLLAEVPGTQTGAPVYRVTDHLGTNVGSLLANGTFVNPVDYMPFGQVFTGNTNDPYMFTSKERDNESGLDYFGARYYGSSMGRWMSPDWSKTPEGVPYADLMNPQSLNLYSYVTNNPLSRTDPDGHDGVWDLAKKYLNVVEVKAAASLGVSVSGQFGVGKAEAHATLIGVEAKTGLAGGGREASVTTGVGASASAGPAKAGAEAGAKVTTADGASASTSAKVAVGPASASASASVDKDGPHTSVGPGGSKNADSDFKVGGSITGLVGVGVSVNFSQLGRAVDSTMDSLNALGGYIEQKYTPSSSPQSGSVNPTPF